MTDLSQFEYITYFSSQRNAHYAYDNVSHKQHSFILTQKYYDNSGGRALCDKCKLSVNVYKVSNTEYYFGSIMKSLTCNERMIKNLLE